MSFASLGLSEALVDAVMAAGYSQPTPVQQRAVPAVLQGRDLMVAAQTGTGKTGGFALPVLELLFPQGRAQRERALVARQPKVLVLTPTRELAAQVHDSFVLYAKNLPFKSACIFGGVGLNPQIQAVSKGLDVLVACPGRLLDLVSQRAVDLSGVEILVLDEADRMLDMGFIHDVRKVLAKLPAKRQNLLFSATFSQDIIELATKLLHDPERIEVTPPNTTVERIEQSVFRLAAPLKRMLLAHLITLGAWEQVLVFTRTKHGANRLAEYLTKNGLPAAAIHGNKSQNARTKALADFKSNDIRVLVATDIAARGLDIDQLPHVVNYELPNVEEDYVHRIGRTGRAGRSGGAVSFVAPDEDKLLRAIERMTKQRIPEGDWMGFNLEEAERERKERAETSGAREDRPARPQRGERSERAPRQVRDDRSARKPQNRPARAERSEAQGEERPARQDRGERNNDQPRGPRGQHGRRRHDNNTQQRHAPSYSPQAAAERDPETFLDDDIDNFGNRVDYVSPYANQGKGRRPQGQRPQRPAQQGQGERRPRTTGHAPAAAARHSHNGKPSNRENNPRQGQTRRNDRPNNRYAGHSGMSATQETRKPEQRKPVIIHKESRLPTAEQLEQLERSIRPRSERPALLTRRTTD